MTTTTESPPTISRDELAERFRAWAVQHDAELDRYRRTDVLSVEDSVEQDRPLIRMLYESGWFRWGWPEETGGLGGDATLRAVVYDALSVHGLEVPEALLALEPVAPPLIHFSPGLAATYLPKLLSGEAICCQGFSEPGAGSDLASLQCRAVARDDHYLINGQKIWTSLGHLADHCMLLARTGAPDSAHRGLTVFWVDLDSPGVSRRPIRLATDRHEVSEMYFDDVVVPKDRVIGEVDGGWTVALYILQCERGMYSWLRQAWLHARLSELLGLPDLAPEAAARFGEVYELLVALRARAGDTVRRLARGDTPGAGTSIDKLLLSTAEQALMDAAREVVLPPLDARSDGLARRWRRDWWYSRAGSIYSGASEIQKSILAQRVLGLPR